MKIDCLGQILPNSKQKPSMPLCKSITTRVHSMVIHQIPYSSEIITCPPLYRCRISQHYLRYCRKGRVISGRRDSPSILTWLNRTLLIQIHWQGRMKVYWMDGRRKLQGTRIEACSKQSQETTPLSCDDWGLMSNKACWFILFYKNYIKLIIYNNLNEYPTITQYKLYKNTII